VVPVTITPPAAASVRLFGGYITLTPDDGGPVLRVPYAGYKGDYQAIVALTPTPAGLPWLARLQGTAFVNQPNGGLFTLVGNDVPFFIFHLDHPVRLLKMKVVDVATGTSFDLATRLEFFARSATATAGFVFAWNGTTIKHEGDTPTPVPDGTYTIELSVLKALGDRQNPTHVESWISPEITIARPIPVP
jgi:hypothetical protein